MDPVSHAGRWLDARQIPYCSTSSGLESTVGLQLTDSARTGQPDVESERLRPLTPWLPGRNREFRLPGGSSQST